MQMIVRTDSSYLDTRVKVEDGSKQGSFLWRDVLSRDIAG